MHILDAMQSILYCAVIIALLFMVRYHANLLTS